MKTTEIFCRLETPNFCIQINSVRPSYSSQNVESYNLAEVIVKAIQAYDTTYDFELSKTINYLLNKKK